VLQHNCARAGAVVQAALQTALQKEAAIACLQEPPVLGGYPISHPGFVFYWPEGPREHARVLTAVRKDLVNKLVINARTDLVNHPYFVVIDVLEGDRCTRLVNCYDNWLGETFPYSGGSRQTRRALRDVNWAPILEGRCLLVGDFNAHSPLWNPYIETRRNAQPLESLLEEHDLHVNNDPEEPTRPRKAPSSREQGAEDLGTLHSIIDLTISNQTLGPLPVWEVEKDCPTPSDHVVIWAGWDSPEAAESIGTSGVTTGWRVRELMEDEETLEKAHSTWKEISEPRPHLTDACSKEEVESEAIWLEEALTKVLNRHAKPVRLCARSKRWWSPAIDAKRAHYARVRRQWLDSEISEESVRQARKDFYNLIRKAKRETWERFLQGADGDSLPEQKRCWAALNYTKPRAEGTTPALKDPTTQELIGTTFEEKERIFRRQAFPQAPESTGELELRGTGNAHELVTEELVQRAIWSQGIDKAPGTDRLNFRAIRLLWGLNKQRVIGIARQCLRLGIQPNTWKTAKGILLRKPGKPDYGVAKAYRVISLLKCLGKVIEKVVADLITDFAEERGIFHEGQFGGRRQRCSGDAVACLIEYIHQAWLQRKLGATLFMDIKGAFDHVLLGKLIGVLRAAGFDERLISWVASFLQGRKAVLVIDGHEGREHPVSSGLPQGSPVSPILFLLYVSGLGAAIEREIPGMKVLSFVDDQGMVIGADSVEEACSTLQRAAKIAIDWGLDNGVQFDPGKTEACFFFRHQRRPREVAVRQARILVGGHPATIKPGAVKWLGVMLDPQLTGKVHFQARLQKAYGTEARLRSLCKASGLSLELARRLQRATVQVIATWGMELWWQGQKTWACSLQKLINRQARAITGMFKSTPIGALIREAALEPAEVLLDSRVTGYTTRLLTLPETHPAALILPITLRHGDTHAQPGEQPLNDREWAARDTKVPKRLGQRLAKHLAQRLKEDPSRGIERTEECKVRGFPGTIWVPSLEEALEKARRQRPGSTLWTDGSHLENGHSGAGVAYQAHPEAPWERLEIPMGPGTEVYDAELLGVAAALEWALERHLPGPIWVMLDAQNAISRLQTTRIGGGQSLAIRAMQAAERLTSRGCLVTIQWVPGHSGVEGNEQADQAAKAAASKPAREAEHLTIAYVRRACTEARRTAVERWAQENAVQGARRQGRAYKMPRGWGIDRTAARAKKRLASRYYQLKVGHAPIGAYLHQRTARESPECRACGEPRETTQHILFECRGRREARRSLYRGLQSAGIPLPTAAEEAPEARLFAEPKATKALLDFVAGTNLYGDMEKAARAAAYSDDWGWDTLEIRDRLGDG
jgi:ribonuclease HI